MVTSAKDFCFCTLALGSKYRGLAKELAAGLELHFPGIILLVYTDQPQDLSDRHNIIAVKHSQQGIRYCYNDKRFVIGEALSKYHSVIWVDADTKIVAGIPDDIQWSPGITSGNFLPIFEHSRNKKVPKRLELIKKLGTKLGVETENVKYVHEDLFIITRDGGKEQEFIQQWGIIANYFELNGIHQGEGNSIGLAASKVGWSVNSHNYEIVKKALQHTYASREKDSRKFWDKLKDPKAVSEKIQRQLSYYYRLNLARLLTLRNFNFYYR
ncbi:hypothetical protein CLI64_24025 [Nostoc sp. CENA543]|uniref:hypothetical protein n=1 Tax=Nostoc sp. CENA543 TaxID=1869241 RepID=UPI000CA0D887|nr:hypothetical protein [Nostoc sp. CENA543]AUT03232.1 hypothetical protein CLI64_24025 [Nostoc sp. CENA543]